MAVDCCFRASRILSGWYCDRAVSVRLSAATAPVSSVMSAARRSIWSVLAPTCRSRPAASFSSAAASRALARTCSGSDAAVSFAALSSSWCALAWSAADPFMSAVACCRYSSTCLSAFPASVSQPTAAISGTAATARPSSRADRGALGNMRGFSCCGVDVLRIGDSHRPPLECQTRLAVGTTGRPAVSTDRINWHGPADRRRPDRAPAGPAGRGGRPAPAGHPGPARRGGLLVQPGHGPVGQRVGRAGGGRLRHGPPAQSGVRRRRGEPGRVARPAEPPGRGGRRLGRAGPPDARRRRRPTPGGRGPAPDRPVGAGRRRIPSGPGPPPGRRRGGPRVGRRPERPPPTRRRCRPAPWAGQPWGARRRSSRQPAAGDAVRRVARGRGACRGGPVGGRPRGRRPTPARRPRRASSATARVRVSRPGRPPRRPPGRPAAGRPPPRPVRGHLLQQRVEARRRDRPPAGVGRALAGRERPDRRGARRPDPRG